MNRPKSNAQVAEAYRRFHRGQTLIFASSVKHAYALAELIEGAVVVDGKTPMDERRQIIEDFTARKIPVIINFGVFTEGTDMPLIETILLARPTRNSTLYTQMVGRGLRLYEDPETGYKKQNLLLIDCVGDSDKNDICTAPSLIGIDPSDLDENEKKAVRGPLSGLRDRIEASEDTPEAGFFPSARSTSRHRARISLGFAAQTARRPSEARAGRFACTPPISSTASRSISTATTRPSVNMTMRLKPRPQFDAG